MVFPASFFFIFVFSIQLTVNKCTIWSLLMTGFEPLTSGVRSDHSTNWAITTAHEAFFLPIVGNLFSVPSQWLTRCFFKQDLQDFVKFQLILPFLSANRYFRYFPLFFLDICHSTAVVRCTRMMAYNQDKAFVWLEKVKIRKGNPTNASNGLKYFLLQLKWFEQVLMDFRFQQLLEVPSENDDEDKYTSVSDDPLSNLILEVIKNDNLRRIERSKRHEMEHSILMAAKLISPVTC